MNSQEIVESFIQNHSKNYKKFFITLIIVDVVILAIFIYLIFNVINEEYSSYAAYIMVAIVFITLYINIRIHFGSYKGYLNGDNLTRFYKRKKKEFEKVQKKYKSGKIDELTFLEAQKSFEQSIEQIAQRIKVLGE